MKMKQYKLGHVFSEMRSKWARAMQMYGKSKRVVNTISKSGNKITKIKSAITSLKTKLHGATIHEARIRERLGRVDQVWTRSMKVWSKAAMSYYSRLQVNLSNRIARIQAMRNPSAKTLALLKQLKDKLDNTRHKMNRAIAWK